MRAAIWAEVVKLAGSTVGRVGSISDRDRHLGAQRLDAARRCDYRPTRSCSPSSDRSPTGDWNGFLLGAAQITGAGGLGGFAVVLAWMFGREFGDGTITGLFALPVRRTTIALAKLIVYVVWVVGDERAARGSSSALVGTLAGLGLDRRRRRWRCWSRQVALGVMSAAITLAGRLGGDPQPVGARRGQRRDRPGRRRTGVGARRTGRMDAAGRSSAVGDLGRRRLSAPSSSHCSSRSARSS